VPSETQKLNKGIHSIAQTVALGFVILFGFGIVVMLSRWVDATKPAANAQLEEERLYLTGNTVKRMSLGFGGLMADWYWLRSLQYVGNKFMNVQHDIQLDDLGPLDLRLLYPLLDTATTLDPHFLAPYSYGAVVLPAVNAENAIKLIRKGIEANPAEWRLYQHLGYMYWKRGEYQNAAQAYADGSNIAGSPHWMREMSARMTAEGGSHQMAREMYERLYEETDDQAVKELLARRILQVASFDDRDAIRKAIDAFKQKNGRCARSWNEMAVELRAVRLPDGKPLKFDSAGAPLDPDATAYVLKQDKCEVDLDPKSKVPMK
jgi:tetratricopeptide (TPR) repeat protein